MEDEELQQRLRNSARIRTKAQFTQHLQRRIAREKEPSANAPATRRIPAFAISLAAVLLVGTVSFYVAVKSGLFESRQSVQQFQSSPAKNSSLKNEMQGSVQPEQTSPGKTNESSIQVKKQEETQSAVQTNTPTGQNSPASTQELKTTIAVPQSIDKEHPEGYSQELSNYPAGGLGKAQKRTAQGFELRVNMSDSLKKLDSLRVDSLKNAQNGAKKKD
jgi:type II secretory pathway component PulJ